VEQPNNQYKTRDRGAWGVDSEIDVSVGCPTDALEADEEDLQKCYLLTMTSTLRWRYSWFLLYQYCWYV